jgi:transposase
LFSYGSLEERVPYDHPLRLIREMVDAALNDMSPRFDAIYGEDGRKSIPPERLLRALLVQLLYSVRSEWMLMEQLQYNLLFRWFVGMGADEPVWHPTVFTKNRDRLLKGAVSEEFFSLIVEQARTKKLLSDEHFTVDGTLIEAWAGQKSFQRKKSNDDILNPPPRDPGNNPTVNWHKQKRRNDTHQSLTDPFARLFKKTRGAEAKLAYMGHCADREPQWSCRGCTADTGHRHRGARGRRRDAEGKPASRPATLGADRGYDTAGFVKQLREMKITPHVAQNDSHRRSAVDARTTRHGGYAISQRKRKRVEEVFGWMKTVGCNARCGSWDPTGRAGCSH